MLGGGVPGTPDAALQKEGTHIPLAPYDIVVIREVSSSTPDERDGVEFGGVKIGKEAPVVVYALLQQPANLFPKRTVGEHIPVCSKLWPIGATEWSIWVSCLDPALKFQDPLLDQENSIHEDGPQRKG